MKELIIKVNNEAVHLSPELVIPMQKTNIPIQHCTFSSHEDIFWTVHLFEYDSDKKSCKLKVVDYLTKDIENYKSQIITNEIERITFEKFIWKNLDQHLTRYTPSMLLTIIQDDDVERYFREKPKEKDVWGYSPNNVIYTPNSLNNNNLYTYKLRESAKELQSIEFTFNFSNAYFKLGHITFTKYLKEVDKKVDFIITNDHILAEFEHIKAWFAKVLKTKKFKVFATIITVDNEITEVTATSPQIEMIDAALIDSIKYQRTIALTKAPKLRETEKTLFTAEEIFGEMETDIIEGNVFNQNEQEILSSLLEHKNTRNRKQLEYLSEKKQSVNDKIRFTLNPYFGFLFYIEGKESNHFVWELLDSHATYLWSIGKSESGIGLLYQRVEASINIIKRDGREQYKRAYKQNLIDNDLTFCIIEHNDISSNLDEGFAKWKQHLNDKIT